MNLVYGCIGGSAYSSMRTSQVKKSLVQLNSSRAGGLEACPDLTRYSTQISSSMDWFKGKSAGKSAGNQRFCNEIWGVPLNLQPHPSYPSTSCSWPGDRVQFDLQATGQPGRALQAVNVTGGTAPLDLKDAVLRNLARLTLWRMLENGKFNG